MKLVYIIILNYNGWGDTIECLESVFRNDYPDYRVIVIDNGSSDGSMESIKAWAEGRLDVLVPEGNDVRDLSFPPVEKSIPYVEYSRAEAESGGRADERDRRLVLIQTGENLGFAGGNNVGCTYALSCGASFCFLLNNDAVIAPDAISILVKISSEARAAIVGAKVLDKSAKKVLFSGRNWPAHLFGLGSMKENRGDTQYVSSGDVDGCAFLVSRDVLVMRHSDSGYYLDPSMFMYCEDTDFCRYAASVGFRCVVAYNAVAYHGLSQSSGGAGNPGSYYYVTRNRIFLAERWLGLFGRLLFHAYYVPSRAILQIARCGRQKPGVRKAIIGGLLDGYRNTQGKWEKGARSRV